MLTLILAIGINAVAYTYSIPHDGQYPDAKQTPGALNPDLTKDVICSSDFRTSAYRHVAQAQKDRAYERESVPAGLHGQGEVDHLISLELGGSNDDTNLWWQPYQNNGSGAHEKDEVENVLHAEVCRDVITLERAQDIVAHSWVDCWKSMEKGEVCR